MKIPSVAMSLACEDKMNFDAAAKYCVGVLKKLLPVKSGEVININIPRLSKGKPKGIKVVPQSTGGFQEYYVRQKNEQNQDVFKLAGGQHNHEDRLTDMTSIIEGYITVTALIPDMTDRKKTAQLAKIKWHDIG